MSDMVQLTIDGREVEVPKGTGLVEAAAMADIEVPVFCYEERIGPAVGACRMCMVEIEGMPKLQTACSTMAGNGMNVTTVSGRAREAQEAVLEFLLINHPLDCPVCDKGGECPLQDQTMRWGPGGSRFGETKRNNDKPIPVSPLIALDRERCILCYRCTRFSAEVSQDNQLISRERGANTVISTFEGRPYEGHFSGNIIELCPVGALTSTEYRFHGRPWDTVDLPTTCSQCSVGCNTYATVREGQVQRVISRRNDAVDEGWLCDRGRFSYTANAAAGRLRTPEVGESTGTRAPASWEVALETLHTRLDGDATTWVLGGTTTLEEAWVVRELAAATGGSVVAVPGAAAAHPASATAQADIQDIETAAHIVILGDEDLAEIAPVLDLRVRKAMTRRGATVTVVGAGGTSLEPAGATLVPVAPADMTAFIADLASGSGAASELADSLQNAPSVVFIAPDGLVGAKAFAGLSRPFSLTSDGSGVVAVPRHPSARGLAALGIAELSGDAPTGGVILLDVDPARDLPAVWQDLSRASWVCAASQFADAVHHHATIVLPAASTLETEGTMVNLTGRLQRMAPTVPAPGGRTAVQWLTGLLRRRGGTLQPHPGAVYRHLAASDALAGTLPAATYGEIPSTGIPGVSGGMPTTLSVDVPVAGTGELLVHVARGLYDAADVDHAQNMGFLRDTTWITLARPDADVLGVARGDSVQVTLDGTPVDCRVAVSRRMLPGNARIRSGMAGIPQGACGYHAAPVTVSTAAGAAH